MRGPLLIAILVTAAVALLTDPILRLLGEGSRHWAEDLGGGEGPFPRRLAMAALGVVIVPGWVRRRWDSPELERRMTHSAVSLSKDDFVALRWATLLLGLVLGAGMAVVRDGDLVGIFLGVVLAAAGVWGPPIWLSLKVEARQMDLDLALPDFLDRLTLGLQAGLGFEVALRRSAVNFPGQLGDEIRRLVRQLDRGHARSAALDEAVDRNPSQDLRAFAAAVKQADRLGTSLARALRVQSELLRARRRRRAQEASRRLPILIVFPLVFFFLPALMIVFLAPPLLLLFLGG